MGNLRYLIRSAGLLLDGERRKCPNCGGEGAAVSRKFAVTALRRCGSCQLLYRTPTETPGEAEKFYNDDYVQGDATDLPSLDELEAMKADGFAEFQSNYNSYSAYAAILRALGAPADGRVFDYGCSWGYGSYLFAKEGFRVKSYEISRPRRQFGQLHLGIDLAEDFDAFVAAEPGSFDVFFSSHVLEHVPSPSEAIAKGFDLLRPGGLFVSFFPNGSDAYRRRHPEAWDRLWGEVHPNFLDDAFLTTLLGDRPALLGASPVEITPAARAHLDAGKPGVLRLNDLVGYELFVAARKA